MIALAENLEHEDASSFEEASMISLFSSALEQEPDQALSLSDFLSGVKNGRWQHQIVPLRNHIRNGDRPSYDRKKRHLPAVTISCHCLSRERDLTPEAKAITHSGWLQADFDLKDNPILADADSVTAIRAALLADPHVGGVFVGPSGEGLKAVVSINPDPSRHKDSWRAAELHFHDSYGLKLDPSTKDPMRLCFVSFDPEMETSEEFSPLPLPELSLLPCPTPAAQGLSISRDFPPTTAEEVAEMLSFIPPRPDYDTWLRVASAVWSVLPMLEGAQILNKWSPEEREGEYASKHKHRLEQVGIGTLVHMAEEHGFNPKAAFLRKINNGTVLLAEDKKTPISSSQALKEMLPKLPAITENLSDRKVELMGFARSLEPMELSLLARAVKKLTGCPIAAFLKDVKNSCESIGSENKCPEMYFDGAKYYRPRNDSYDSIIREDACLELRKSGLSGNIPDGALISPLEKALHHIQTENRVHYAGAICGRPVGAHREGDIMVLATSGPTIIEGEEGDSSPLERFFANLLGRGQDPYAQIQLDTFVGWMRHFREALRNHTVHQPGQALALVGAPDGGKSLAQCLITHMAGGRSQDASLYFLGDSTFNKELWSAEHLILDDDKLGENGRESHAVRDRLKKVTVANTFLMHAKGKDAVGFRPIWRTTISANLDDESINVLPPVDESFGDKIIYLKCYPPADPFHDGSEGGRTAFWKSLTDAIPAFLEIVDSYELPVERRGSRFFVREFHHPEVLEAINGAASETPLGELIDEFLRIRKEPLEVTASTLFEMLKSTNTGSISAYSRSVRHFGHQLSRLSKLPRWKERIVKVPVRVGGRVKNELVNFWKITPLRSNAE